MRGFKVVDISAVKETRASSLARKNNNKTTDDLENPTLCSRPNIYLRLDPTVLTNGIINFVLIIPISHSIAAHVSTEFERIVSILSEATVTKTAARKEERHEQSINPITSSCRYFVLRVKMSSSTVVSLVKATP